MPLMHPPQPTDTSYESIGPSELSERVGDPGGEPTRDVPREQGISPPFCFDIPSASRDCLVYTPGYKLA